MYASYCKSVDIGSIPVRASTFKYLQNRALIFWVGIFLLRKMILLADSIFINDILFEFESDTRSFRYQEASIFNLIRLFQ